MATPFPELIHAQRLHVCHSPLLNGPSPHLDFKDKRMYVPDDDTPFARSIRNHELGHLKWSMPVLGVPSEVDDTIEAVEDMRINTLLDRTAGITLDLDGAPVDLLASSQRSVSITSTLESLRLLMGFTGFAQFGDVYEHATNEAKELYDTIFKMMWRKGPPSFTRTVEITEWLRERLGDEAHHIRPVMVASRGRPHGTRWGDLTVEQARLKFYTRTLIAGLSRRKVATPEGAHFRYPHRHALDGAVFGRRRHESAGTVLVDVSGSMRFSNRYLKQLLQHRPAAQIAVYNAEQYNHGTLTVVAKDGRYGDLDYVAIGELNVVDGPALDWLRRQRPPRIWISDGRITGVEECRSDFLEADAVAKKRRGRIIQYKNINRFLTALKGGDDLALPFHLLR